MYTVFSEAHCVIATMLTDARCATHVHALRCMPRCCALGQRTECNFCSLNTLSSFYNDALCNIQANAIRISTFSTVSVPKHHIDLRAEIIPETIAVLYY